MHALVVTFEHLPLNFLGCYGNTWIETPNFDRLAAEGIVFDSCFAVDLSAAAAELRGDSWEEPPREAAWWTGRSWRASRSGSALHGETPAGAAPTVIDALVRAGVRATLCLEAPSPSHCWPRFNELRRVNAECEAASAQARLQSPHSALRTPHSTLAEHPFAQLADLGVECLRNPSAPGPWLLWLHSRGVPSPWVPPREVAGMYWDEFFQPEALLVALDAAGVPLDAALSADDVDPEELLNGSIDTLAAHGLFSRGHAPAASDASALRRAVYAAYVSALDSWFGKLSRAWSELAADDSVLIVTAASGDLTAPHPQVSAGCPPLVDGLVHVPLLVRLGRGEPPGTRRRALVSLADLAATLAEWFGVPFDTGDKDSRSLVPLLAGAEDSVRDVVHFGADGIGWGVRMDKFSLLVPAAAGSPADGDVSARPRMFHKPDDVGDVHDVAEQHPDLVEQLVRQFEL
jgi:arylsulfatase A-like enzyme